MMPAIAAPFFDGEGEPLTGYAMEVELRRAVANPVDYKRALSSVSQMKAAARRVAADFSNPMGCA